MCEGDHLHDPLKIEAKEMTIAAESGGLGGPKELRHLWIPG